MRKFRICTAALVTLAFAACDQAEAPLAPTLEPSFTASAGSCNAGVCDARALSVSGSALPTSGTQGVSADALLMSISAIGTPDAAYVAATTLVDISAVPDETLLGSITHGTQTVTFSSTMEKRQVGVSWATWNSPPAVETATPHILFSTANALTLNLAVPSMTFGFELEPNRRETFAFTAHFYSGGGTVLEGSVTRTVNGNAGALLFAARSLGAPIDQVRISAVGEPVGFAIARVRYQSLIPVEVDVKPGAFPNPVNLGAGGMLPVAILTTPGFNAADVEPSTVTLGDDDGFDTPVATRNNDTMYARLEDVDSDGDLDLVLHFRVPALVGNEDLDAGSTELFLNGSTTGGVPIKGSDSVVGVP